MTTHLVVSLKAMLSNSTQQQQSISVRNMQGDCFMYYWIMISALHNLLAQMHQPASFMLNNRPSQERQSVEGRRLVCAVRDQSCSSSTLENGVDILPLVAYVQDDICTLCLNLGAGRLITNMAQQISNCFLSHSFAVPFFSGQNFEVCQKGEQGLLLQQPLCRMCQIALQLLQIPSILRSQEQDGHKQQISLV